MKPDDPVLHLVNISRRNCFLEFVETGNMSDELKDEIRTNAACLFGLNIRAHYEESILIALRLRRQIDAFLITMPAAIRPDLMTYFTTDQAPPRLQAFLRGNQFESLKIRTFLISTSLVVNIWEEEAGGKPRKNEDRYAVIARRFRRLRKMFQAESGTLADPILRLIAAQHGEDFQTFISTGVTDETFANYLNADFSCLRAVKIQVHYEDNILYLLGFQRRMTAFARQFEPKWRSEFLAYFSLGSISDEFKEYLDEQQDLSDSIKQYLGDEQEHLERRVAESDMIMNDNASDQASLLVQSIMRIRSRWLEEDLRP